MNGSIESIHIFDERHTPILSHIYCGRPLSAPFLVTAYLAQPTPRQNLIFLQSTNPPTLLFNLQHDNLLFFATTSEEIEPLVVLDFLRRVVDALEEFVGAPLLSVKVEHNYEVVAQLLHEMCDAGIISTTEPNALRDIVEVEGWMDKILGSITLPSSNMMTPSFGSGFAKPTIQPVTPSPAFFWRRANVKHTTNEMFCDIIESLSITLAPSGRPIAAFAHGTIAFNSKVSGIPDILVMLSSLSGAHTILKTMNLPTFHPCVRLQKWMEKPGQLSFVPPDGKFVLASYEVDLLPFNNGKLGNMSTNPLKLPVDVEVKTGLGPTGAEFEVCVYVNKTFMATIPTASMRGPRGPTSSQSPALDDLTIKIPFSEDVKNIPDIRPTRGDAVFSVAERHAEWKISAKDLASSSGYFGLRCTVQGVSVDDEESDDGASTSGLYDFDAPYQRGIEAAATAREREEVDGAERDMAKVAQNRILMPGAAVVSFTVKNWLASGVKVGSIELDTRRSKGLGEGVKPFKGVKYMTVSKEGIELRC